ncbi:LuxR family two component transcriptional regulator [Stackebrandtia endophytica]|uniref:LuxR family two component transcriptional regulator n=1 Tax=Stackebrandtia endophytica TaxID=1496996 RepID=A0A543AZM5_9ACTN|nr:response regulator transcription factor [Stackebrandtia endophytica]TQL78034.1 LuxR family two component transcriptional regulator [Stackebrandtia endophytica]
MRLFLVDDHPVVRAGLSALVEGEPDMEIVGEAGDAETAVAGVRATAPEVVLMDIQLSDGPDGIETTRRLLQLPDPPRVLILTTYESDADIRRAVDVGATGYLLKACPPEELFAAIRSAAKGESALSPKVAARVMSHARSGPPSLTGREAEILNLLAKGLGNRAIATRLYVTEATVKTHLVHIFGKLGVDNRTAAVAVAVERGLIRLS